MNEDEFRQALHATMTVAQPPDPMNETPVLDLAKRAERRRKAVWAGAGSAAAVTAVVAGAVVLAPTVDDGAPALSVGGPTSTTGEQTATAGERYDQGVTLSEQLTGAVPAGYEASHASLRSHQAAINSYDSWEYFAYVPVSAGGGVGKLFADVNPVPNTIAGEGCELSRTLWRMGGGTCEEVTVAGTTLGVITDAGPDARFDQWVGYRHADGTVVYIAQDDEFAGSGRPPLSTLPFTSQELAELATDARFRLG